MRLLKTLMQPLGVAVNGIVKIRLIILASILFIAGNITAQTPAPYISIRQNASNIIVVDSVSTGPVGSASMPTRLDFGSEFTISVFVDKDSYSGKTLFLYMQDTQTGTGGINNWWLQGASVITNLQFTGPTTPSGLPNVDKYDLIIPTEQYPVLMNSGTAWTKLLDGSIIRPTLYVGFTSDSTTIANWGDAVINFIDIWGYKGRMDITDPQPSNQDVIIEIDQYTPINKNLEQMLLDGIQTQDSITVPNGYFKLDPAVDSETYTWYMKDEYGVSPYTYLVNNPNPWLNNIYQTGFKPWINSTHIDTVINMSTAGEYWLPNSSGNICYVLTYYVIPTSYVTSSSTSPYVDPAIFNQYARKVIIKIKPYITPLIPGPGAPPSVPSGPSPLISNAFTIASQDYGSAVAGTQWKQASLETSYTPAGNYLPNDGEYSLAQDIMGIIGGSANTRPPDWYVPAGGAYAPAKKYDHTSGNGTGFMYIVNAKEAGGIFYKETFAVCPKMNLQFSMWLFNICDGTRDNNSWNSKYRIKPNVHVQIYSGNLSTPEGIPLLDYYTGEIPMTGSWEQYFTPIFNVQDGVTDITVFYLSVNGSGDGNDFMMDDIQIQRSNGAFDFSLTNVAQCLTASSDKYDIQAVWDTTVTKQMYENGADIPFKWTFYPNIMDPTTITSTTTTEDIVSYNGTTSGSAIYPDGIIFINVTGDKAGTYKLEINESGSDQCATFSYYVFSPTPKPKISVNPDTADTTCVGTQAGLRVKNISANIDASKLLWYFIQDGTTESPLLDSNGNQLTGDSITVHPTQTTTYIAKMINCSDSVTYTMEVVEGSAIGFGSGEVTSGYVHRVCYTDQEVFIPIVSKTGPAVNYAVFLDGVAGDTLTKGSTSTGQLVLNLNSIKPSRDNFRKGMNTVTLAVIVPGDDCGSIQTFKIRFISEFSAWVPGLNGNTPKDSVNWNNDHNWYITDSLNNRYAEGGVPMACTNVVIPGDAAYYPILKATYTAGVDSLPTDDGFNSLPKCNDITFQFGGEVAQLQNLQYVRAFVELNLGTYNSSASFTNNANLFNTDNGSNYYSNYFSRDRYYSLSAPLKEMFSGDYSFGGKPNVYMKYADTISVLDVRQDVTVSLINKWTNSINSYNIPFTAGFGFGYEVYSGDLQEPWPTLYKNNQKNLNSALGVVRWPYYMNSAYDSINPLHKFTGDVTGTGQSVFTYYEEGKPNNPLSKTDAVNRTSVSIGGVTVPAGNRFILENNSNVIPADTAVFIGTQKAGKEVLIGNPFLSHLDFKEFYLENGKTNGTIGQYYRTWLGTAQYYTVKVDENGNYVTSTSVADTIAGFDMLIPPMQSFFVPVLDNVTGDVNVNFNIANMSKTVIGKSVALRSSHSGNVKEILKITAANSRYSATAVIISQPGVKEKELGEGVPKLFSPNGNIPEIYLIQDYKKEIIEINETPQAIPLEISTKVTVGDLKLTFTGLENFSSKVVLKDMKTGETKTLSVSDNVYSFMNSEGDQKNRFFLLLNGYTGIDRPAPQYVSVFAANRRVHVEASALDPVRSVAIYNLTGQRVESADGLSASTYESRYMGEKGIYIVQVKTKNNASVTQKVIIY
ncbi:hypothetical protein FACS189451_05900 [Bacteroidia bacterium]|nr:hypothetical protein FACS189451_05900 [Bacteroidia bacterium]